MHEPSPPPRCRPPPCLHRKPPRHQKRAELLRSATGASDLPQTGSEQQNRPRLMSTGVTVRSQPRYNSPSSIAPLMGTSPAPLWVCFLPQAAEAGGTEGDRASRASVRGCRSRGRCFLNPAPSILLFLTPDTSISIPSAVLRCPRSSAGTELAGDTAGRGCCLSLV